MSLYIETEKVTAALIGTAWHDISTGTFTVDRYDFAFEDDPLHDTKTMGFGFKSSDTGEWIYGPLTALLAVTT